MEMTMRFFSSRIYLAVLYVFRRLDVELRLVECLPDMHKALGSNLSTAQKQAGWCTPVGLGGSDFQVIIKYAVS